DHFTLACRSSDPGPASWIEVSLSDDPSFLVAVARLALRRRADGNGVARGPRGAAFGFRRADEGGADPAAPLQDEILLTLVAGHSGFAVEVRFDCGLFDEEAARFLAERFMTLLESGWGRPDCRISQLSLLGEAEARRTLTDWNATGAARSAVCVHRLFEDWADRTPQATALVFGTQAVTYGELERRANRLAHHLRTLGAGCESRVGICMDRSPDMVAAVLATWKAGAAYVPLDPEYPRGRLVH